MPDATHDPVLRSRVGSANGHADIPIQDRPLGVLSPPDAGAARVGAAIGGLLGSLPETARGGEEPVRLPSGETRRFVEDGDEIILRARAAREGFVPTGFGDCRAAILPAN